MADRSLLGARLQARARRLRRWLFPARIEPPEEVTRLLAAVYPRLDLGAVSFYHGIPHLIRRFGSQAITLPALFARRRTCIYVAPACWNPESIEGLGTLIHEGYHGLQAQDAGWGLGPLRPFLMLYFAHGAANRFRYHGHPMEEAAYGVAGRRGSRFEAAFAGRERPDPEAVARAGLATAASGLRFWRGLARSLPGAPPPFVALPLLPFWFLLWAGAVALVWLARLLVEGAGTFVIALLWGCGVFLSAIETLLY